MHKKILSLLLSCAIALPLLSPGNELNKSESVIHAIYQNVMYGDVK